ncbi:MAG: ABC transporter permease [Chloroflexi bacterium]|nr:ABC transporter permease [Chloroflexota bacterium]
MSVSASTQAEVAAANTESRRRWQVSQRRRRYLLVAPPMLVMVAFIVLGIFADVIAPGDPGDTNLLSRLEPPVFSGGTSEFPLGTDHVGRDIWTRVVHGARVSLIVVAIVVPGAALFGTVIGMFAGWRGGIVGQLLMRYVDVQLALPAILFAVLLGAVLGASLRNVILILLVWTWTVYARLIRAEVLSLKEREFVLASLAAGGSNWWIMRKQLLPNVFNTIVVIMTLEIPIVIVAEASLSFLGVGAPVEQATWGRMITEARNYLTHAWWVMWMPGLALMLVALSGNLVGDWLRDLLDPRLRNLG